MSATVFQGYIFYHISFRLKDHLKWVWSIFRTRKLAGYPERQHRNPIREP